MNRSFSSARLWALALVVVLLSPAPWMVRLSGASQNTQEEAPSSPPPAPASFLTVSDRRLRHHHRSHPHRITGASSGPLRRAPPESWCQHCRLRPPPLEEGGEIDIDPRYGVEKRLVPTGPNPLHN